MANYYIPLLYEWIAHARYSFVHLGLLTGKIRISVHHGDGEFACSLVHLHFLVQVEFLNTEEYSLLLKISQSALFNVLI